MYLVRKIKNLPKEKPGLLGETFFILFQTAKAAGL
jgi:hypothetical protein